MYNLNTIYSSDRPRPRQRSINPHTGCDSLGAPGTLADCALLFKARKRDSRRLTSCAVSDRLFNGLSSFSCVLSLLRSHDSLLSDALFQQGLFCIRWRVYMMITLKCWKIDVVANKIIEIRACVVIMGKSFVNMGMWLQQKKYWQHIIKQIMLILWLL